MLIFEEHDWVKKVPVIDRILCDDITGAVFSAVLPAVTVNCFKDAIAGLKGKFITDLNNGNGFSLPSMFGQLHKSQPIESVEHYFHDIPSFCEAVNTECGFDVEEWLKQQLSLAFAPHHALCLPGFLPYSIRVVFPGKGGLYVHKDGKLLPFIHDNVSERIERYIQPETMMSWYFTLQAPEEGGELWVAGDAYAAYEKEGQFDMVSPEGLVVSADEMISIKVKPATGSLLVFKGGSYWHKVVPPPLGSTERITLGGFMALAAEGDLIYFWS